MSEMSEKKELSRRMFLKGIGALCISALVFGHIPMAYGEEYTFFLTPLDEEDLRSRAGIIRTTGFFNELTEEEIFIILTKINNCAILNVDSKEGENVSESLYSIINHYENNTLTDEDLQKIEALKHIARVNSNISRVLCPLEQFVESILLNKDSLDAKDNLVVFFEEFYESIINGGDLLDSDRAFRKSYLDAYIVFNFFVKPLKVFAYPNSIVGFNPKAIEFVLDAKHSGNSFDAYSKELLDFYGSDHELTKPIPDAKKLVDEYSEELSKVIEIEELFIKISRTEQLSVIEEYTKMETARFNSDTPSFMETDFLFPELTEECVLSLFNN